MAKQKVQRIDFITLFFLAVAFFTALLPLRLSGTDRLNAGAEELTPDTNYWFEEARVEIDVNKDKTFSVAEKYKVGFQKGGINTGFIRDIQRISKTTRIVDGKKKSGKKYLAKISDIKATVDGEAAKVTQGYYNAGQFFSVKMQKADGSYFDATDIRNEASFHEFVLSYVYDMSDDKIAGCDDFTFDVLGYEMALTKVFSATVAFPDEIDASKVSMRTNDKQTWSPDGNKKEELSIGEKSVTLIARPYAKKKGYTVQVLLSEGYFQTARTYVWYYWLFVFPVAGLMIAGVSIAIIYFPRKAVEPAEVVPPKGISLMRASALLYGEARMRDVPALILEWAAKGYVVLEQDGKRNIIIRKIENLPAKEGNKKTEYFNALFRSESGEHGDTLATKSLRRSVTLGARTKQIKLRQAARNLKFEADLPDPMYKRRNLSIGLLYFSAVLPVLLMLIYNAILSKSAVSLFFFIFLAAATAINYHGRTSAYSFVPLIFMVTFPFPALGSLLFDSFIYYDYAFLSIVSVVWWAVAYILHFFMTRRTSEANADLGRLKGFKRFLLTAELPRIRLLFDENPEWFSTVLPYCYVMGISKKVEKRYKVLGITAPEWMNGSSVSSLGRCVSRGIGSVGGGSSGGGGGGHGGSSGGGGGGGGSRGC